MKKILVFLLTLVYASLAFAQQIECLAIPFDCNRVVAITLINCRYYDSVAPNQNYFFYYWSSAEGGLQNRLNLAYHDKSPYQNVPTNDSTGRIPSALFQFTTSQAIRDAGYEVYDNEEAFFAAALNKNATDSCVFGYIMAPPENENADSVLLLCIVHYNDKMISQSGYKFELSSEQCALASQDIDLLGFSYVVVSDNFDLWNDHLSCSNTTNTFRPVFLKGEFDNESGSVVPVLVGADFDVVLCGLDQAEADTIKKALTLLHDEYPVFNDNDAITAKGTFTQPYADLLNLLKDQQLIYFNRHKYEQYTPYGIELQMVLFPIQGTAYEIDMETGDSLGVSDICLDNLYSYATITNMEMDDIGLVFGDSYHFRSLPLIKRYEPYTVRLYLDDLEPLYLPVLDKYQVDSLTDCWLIESNDPAFNNSTKFHMINTSLGDWSSATFVIDTVRNDTAFHLSEGYYYRFKTQFDHSSSGLKVSMPPTAKSMQYCDNGPEFILKIIPHTVVYMGTDEDWNQDVNWATADSLGNIIHDEAFVPSYETNVIIPGDRIVLPELLTCVSLLSPALAETATNVAIEDPTEFPASRCDDPSKWNIKGMSKYERGFRPSMCDTVYFQAGSELGNQQYLEYNHAEVDVAVPTEQWSLTGFALTDMVSGDMFVELNDHDNPFVVPTQGNRKNVRVWQKLYNRNMESMTWSGINDTINSTAWNTPTNTVRHRYQPGTAVLVWPLDNSDGNVTDANNNIIFRFPKEDTTYYYFTSNGEEKTNVSESVVLPNDGGRYSRLAFDCYSFDGAMTLTLYATSSSTMFAMANPTLDWIDIDEFIKYNQDLLDPQYDVIVGADGETTISQISVVGTRSNVVDNAIVNTPANGWLKPGQAIMLHTKVADTTIDVGIPYKAFKAQIVDPLWKRQQAPMANKATLYMKAVCNGQTSYASLYTDVAADNNYKVGEDAEILFVDDETTPAAIYTIASGKALTINGLSSFNSVPVSIYTVDNTIRKASVTFTGVDSFDGDISLLDVVTGKTTLISEGDVLTLATTAKNGNIRYYLQKTANTTTDIDITENDDTIKIFIAADGTIQIIANDELLNVVVYGAAGQEVMHNEAINGRCISYSLPAGVYVVKVYTQQQQMVKKVIVK